MLTGPCASYQMNENPNHCILIVDDDEVDIIAIQKSFTCNYCEFISCRTGEEALEVFDHGVFDCVILDYMLPDIKGDELFDQIQSVSSVPVILITGHGDEELAVKMLKKGVANYLSKENLDLLEDAALEAIKVHATFIKSVKRLQEKLDRSSIINGINYSRTS